MINFLLRKLNRKEDTLGKKGSRGTSLIEVIVSMLIMSLVVVPLVNNFVVVSRTNVKARQVKAATDFAQQIMETLQSYGADSVNDQFWNGHTYSHSLAGADGTTSEHQGTNECNREYPCELDTSYNAEAHRMAFNIVNINKESQGDPLTDYYKVYTDDSFSDEADRLYSTGQKRCYNIVSAMSDAGDVYDVQIVYDPSSYGSSAEKKDADDNILENSRAFNVNNFPDISTLDSDKTAVVNPNGPFVNPVINDSALTSGDSDSDIYERNDDGISYKFTRGDPDSKDTSGRSYEDIVSEAYYELYEGYYQEIVSAVQESLYSHYAESSVTINASAFRTSNPTKAEKLASIQADTTRTTVFTVTESSSGLATLTGEVVYELTDTTEIGNKATVKTKLSSIISGLTDGENELSADQKEAISDELDTEIDAIDKEYTSSDNLVRSMEVYYDDDEMDLENIYYMYTPLSSGWKADSLKLTTQKASGSGEDDSDEDKAEEMVSSDRKITLYLVPQVSLMDSDLSSMTESSDDDILSSDKSVSYRKMKLTGTDSIKGLLAKNITVNYVKNFADIINTANSNDDTIISKFNEAQNVLYDITVRIFKHDDSKCLAELTLSGI